MRVSQDDEMSERVIHRGVHPLGNCSHLHSFGQGKGIWSESACPQQCPPWKTALLMRCLRAAWVGGMESKSSSFLCKTLPACLVYIVFFSEKHETVSQSVRALNTIKDLNFWMPSDFAIDRWWQMFCNLPLCQIRSITLYRQGYEMQRCISHRNLCL